jgi:hypothetical protein
MKAITASYFIKPDEGKIKGSPKCRGVFFDPCCAFLGLTTINHTSCSTSFIYHSYHLDFYLPEMSANNSTTTSTSAVETERALYHGLKPNP